MKSMMEEQLQESHLKQEDLKKRAHTSEQKYSLMFQRLQQQANFCSVLQNGVYKSKQPDSGLLLSERQSILSGQLHRALLLQNSILLCDDLPSHVAVLDTTQRTPEFRPVAVTLVSQDRLLDQVRPAVDSSLQMGSTEIGRTLNDLLRLIMTWIPKFEQPPGQQETQKSSSLVVQNHNRQLLTDRWNAKSVFQLLLQYQKGAMLLNDLSMGIQQFQEGSPKAIIFGQV